MKRITGTIALAIALAMLIPATGEARGRQNEKGRQTTEQRQQRPGNQGRGPGSANHVNDNRRPTHTSRPNNDNKKQPQYHNDNRPGDNRRPDMNHHQSNRPSQQPGFRPQGNHHMTPPAPRPPQRPLMPANRPWYRPTPPPAFRPAPGWRPFNSILGVALGSAINFTVNALINNGYTVAGYGNNAVYVTDVPMLNLVWPDATLYYGNNGLYGSEFVYSTPSYSLSRYNTVYNQLVMNYGAPFQVRNSGGIISSAWWGPGNQFITLTFQSGTAYNGSNRFYTTLSFGN